jgi:hypothetical protein
MRNLALSIALAAAMAGDASAQPLQVAQASAPPIQPLRPTPRPIRLPAEISSQHAIYVQARVNGSAPLWFLLDSAGGSPLIIDRVRATEMRLPLTGLGLGVGAGEAFFEMSYAHGVSLSVDGISLDDQTAAATSLETVRRYAGRALDGILGYELFNRYVVDVQYETGIVNLYEPVAYRYTGSGEVVPADLDGKHFRLRTRINFEGSDPLDATLLVDTGAAGIVAILNKPYVDAHHLLSANWNKANSRRQAGLGGETLAFSAPAHELALGRFVFRNVMVEFSRDEKGLFASPDFDGILGAEMLRRFRVIFDHYRQRIIFEPNRGVLDL